MVGISRPPSPRTISSIPLEDYETSSTDSDETTRMHTRSRVPFVQSTSPTGSSSGSPRSDFLFPPNLQSGRSSVSSTATTTPIPSRSTSPLPQFYSNPSSSSTSDTDSEPNSPFLRTNRNPWGRENRRTWWSASRRRRKRDTRVLRTLKKWIRKLVRHPFFPSQPITIVLTLILLSIFAIFLTLLLIYILNPDKEPLPWRAYCSAPHLYAPHNPAPPSSTSFPYFNATSAKPFPPFPPQNLDTFSPAGIFLGVFSIDSGFERRMLVRTTWASHPRSRNGAGEGDASRGTSRTIVRFILGQPRKDWERRIKLEMETYNDIIILPIPENMNGGKTHAFFSWASANAWVPPIHTDSSVPPVVFSYSNQTTPPPSFAPHDTFQAWKNQNMGRLKPWVRPDFVVKVDDDSFVMLAELESRLRLELYTKTGTQQEPKSPLAPNTSMTSMPAPGNPTGDLLVPDRGLPPLSVTSEQSNDPLIYWGYLVRNRLHTFMAGELYALSWSLVDWVAKDSVVKGLTRGAEDKQTAKWMKLHPRASEVRWTSERCWIYDHPRSGTVYAHGFLFPAEVARVKRGMEAYFDKSTQGLFGNPSIAVGGISPTPSAWAYSSVSTFGVRYTPPVPDLGIKYSIEALVEGSDMSMVREGSPMTPDYAWTHREGRKRRYEGNRVGGTVVVHFIKKNMWYLETALALLEGEELLDSETLQSQEPDRTALGLTPSPSNMPSHTAQPRSTQLSANPENQR
ncbi:hypothetical protein BDZ94DRAFT_1274185 [Collybia nuda]|uniref:Glycosyltransferase family 31 protein n=1 Tax=Collybia nuda TaxID=64659 RepID=A0A9P6CCF1_9AGAR|nr:hypothetical protein BDZ94DRAFT_1274185 [Collybia nuda]